MKGVGILSFILIVLINSCKKEEAAAPAVRSYRMGFQNSAPRFDDFNLTIQSLQLWSARADAAMITTEVPWDSLYAGHTIQRYILNNYSGLVDYYRTNNFKLWMYIDPANGLNRGSDANALVAMGKSIAQDDVQKLYRRFVVAMDSMLQPDHLGLALETNLIRMASSPSIYSGVKKAANDAAIDVRAIDPTVKLSVSIQAEVAWGIGSPNGYGNFVGIEQDLTDFPFAHELGISSYPYFNAAKPGDLPIEYYAKLVAGKSMPIFVSEGGWTSQTFTARNQQVIAGSTTLQQDYVTRQSQLLDQAKAIAVFQLTFTDIDLDHLPVGTDPTIKYFAYLGLVDINLEPKPSLTTWDNVFKRKLGAN